MRSPILLSFLVLGVVACGGREQPFGDFGEVTSAVVIVNPVINEGSTTTVEPGTQRSGIAVSAEGAGTRDTDDTGLVVLQDLDVGTIDLELDAGSVPLTVVQEKELYDVILAVRGDTVTHVVPPVRYPIGGAVVEVAAGTDLSTVAEDGAILFLEAGTYPGNLEIRSEGILVFGAWDPEDGPLSIIEGDVAFLGGSGRMRGVAIEGTLSSPANGFSAAFCEVTGLDVTGNSVTLIRNTVTGTQVTVPSSSAVLVDNSGVP